MLQIRWTAVELDVNSDEETTIKRATGLIGHMEDGLKELIMRDAMIQARASGHRLIRIKEVAMSIDDELEPQRFPELGFL